MTHQFVSKYVVLRCESAGVHAGFLVSQEGSEAQLRDARRLWYWKAAGGIALNGVALHGLKPGSKIDVEIPDIALTGVIETIPCSAEAQESIRGYK